MIVVCYRSAHNSAGRNVANRATEARRKRPIVQGGMARKGGDTRPHNGRIALGNTARRRNMACQKTAGREAGGRAATCLRRTRQNNSYSTKTRLQAQQTQRSRQRKVAEQTTSETEEWRKHIQQSTNSNTYFVTNEAWFHKKKFAPICET